MATPATTSAPARLVTRARQARAHATAPLLLELDLTEDVLESAPPDPFGKVLARQRPTVRQVVDALQRARDDDNVRALVARVGRDHRGDLARVQELRDAVLAFRAGGKPAYAWAEGFGEFGPGTIAYYLATAFEEIWLQPSGDLFLTGPRLEAYFLRGALDRLGVTPQFGARSEYKNAPNLFTEHGFTLSHREAAEALTESVSRQVVAGIAAARGLDEAKVRELVDRAPLIGQEAVASGLVDHRGYRDEVYAAVRARVGADSRLQYLTRYARTSSAKTRLRRVMHPAPGRVAVVPAVGIVSRGRSRRGPAGTVMGSDTVGAALRAAARDRSVRAVVLRVDSRGGSYIASDAIRREVALVRAGGKPVVVSMGDVAASGGYFIAMDADVIVAQPGTITGSIGVFAGKQAVDGLLDRLGIGRDHVQKGARAGLFSTARPFAEDEWTQVDRWLDRVYDDFTAKVAAARGMDRETVEKVARGRVWSGADAHQRGLVDLLGGLERAVETAWARAGMPARFKPEVRVYPHVSALRRLRPAESSDDPALALPRVAAATWGRLAETAVESWGPVATLAARLGLSAGGPLLLPTAFEVR